MEIPFIYMWGRITDVSMPHMYFLALYLKGVALTSLEAE
jgi:hypothetical protein